MTNVLKLYNEVQLITDLKVQAFSVIRGCQKIEPVKIIIESYDILDLSLNILDKFPSSQPGSFVYDESAMTHLANLTRHLAIFYHDVLPNPEFPTYKLNITRLLRFCNTPTGILIT